MINAAISLFEATRNVQYLEHGDHFVRMLETWHVDSDGTGHYLTASDSADVPMRIRGDIDEAISSATGQIIEALVRLANITGNIELQQRAWTIAEHAAGRIQG